MYRSCPENLGEPQIVHPLNPKHVLKRNSSARIVSGRPSSEHSLPLLPDGPLSSKFIRNVRGASHWIPSLCIGRDTLPLEGTFCLTSPGRHRSGVRMYAIIPG